MAAPSSLEAVKRKIQCLQQQADEAEDRAQGLQRELDLERDLREKVRPPGLPARLSRSLSPGLPRSFLPVSGSLSLGRAWLSPAPGGRLGRRLPSFLSCPPRCSAPLRKLSAGTAAAAPLPHQPPGAPGAAAARPGHPLLIALWGRSPRRRRCEHRSASGSGYEGLVGNGCLIRKKRCMTTSREFPPLGATPLAPAQLGNVRTAGG